MLTRCSPAASCCSSTRWSSNASNQTPPQPPWQISTTTAPTCTSVNGRSHAGHFMALLELRQLQVIKPEHVVFDGLFVRTGDFDRQLVAFAVPGVEGLVVQRMEKQFRAAPGITEIVLRAGAERGREFLAIHEKLFVALAPPAAARTPDVQHHADVAAAASRLEQGPV